MRVETLSLFHTGLQDLDVPAAQLPAWAQKLAEGDFTTLELAEYAHTCFPNGQLNHYTLVDAAGGALDLQAHGVECLQIWDHQEWGPMAVVRNAAAWYAVGRVADVSHWLSTQAVQTPASPVFETA